MIISLKLNDSKIKKCNWRQVSRPAKTTVDKAKYIDWCCATYAKTTQ